MECGSPEETGALSPSSGLIGSDAHTKLHAGDTSPRKRHWPETRSAVPAASPRQAAVARAAPVG